MIQIPEMIVTFFSDTITYAGDFFISWCVDMIPTIFIVLILTHTLIRLVPASLLEKAASMASHYTLLKYMFIPFIGAILLGNPSALTLGKFMSEKDKPSYYASASFFCHTSNGIFPHINSAELFIWLGISHGVEMLGYSVFPLAMRYLLAGLFANFICGIVTDYTTRYYCQKMQITLSDSPALNTDIKKTDNKTEVSAGSNCEMQNSNDSHWHEIRIEAGRGGFGGPLLLKPDEKRNKLIYIAAGGIKPDIVDTIERLTGCTAVNGFKNLIPDEEVFLAVIDCGGTLRCGIYPKKRIPTVNIMPTGKSGPLARYITEDIYVSAVTEDCITSTENVILQAEETEAASQYHGINRIPGWLEDGMSGLVSILGKGCYGAYKAAQDSVDIILHTLIPLMGFVSLLTAMVECSGLNNFLAEHLTFLASDIIGIFLLGIIISFPLLSPILSPGAIIAQVIGTIIGAQIGNGVIAVSLALPALFAINTQCACDFIPVGLGLAEAKGNTLKVGIPSVLTSRFLTSVIRILIAWIFSFGLYM